MKHYFITFACVKNKRTRTGKVVKKRNMAQATIECNKIKTYSDIENIQKEIKEKEGYSDVAIIGIVKIKKEKIVDINTLETLRDMYEEEIKNYMEGDK